MVVGSDITGMHGNAFLETKGIVGPSTKKWGDMPKRKKPYGMMAESDKSHINQALGQRNTSLHMICCSLLSPFTHHLRNEKKLESRPFFLSIFVLYKHM